MSCGKKEAVILLLKEIRKKNNLTQYEVSQMLNLTLRQYQRIEKGESFLAQDKLNTLEDIFKTPQRVLLAKSYEEVPEFLKNFLP
ncbi:XRE family transcriptional regulator [Heyndrickxia camelliae]|uniref:XRE family transcriptional regulator n=1 Tax=Heyndrickxia camelliae TaxID=1707093 RepID=A0A2N3LEM3_9BACI|nr:XRE family transcriptional regulator [Heyndrickxia camelliae]